MVEKKGIFYAHIQPTFIINLKWKIFFGGHVWSFSFEKGILLQCTVWKNRNMLSWQKFVKPTLLLKKLKKRWFCEKYFRCEWISCFPHCALNAFIFQFHVCVSFLLFAQNICRWCFVLNKISTPRRWNMTSLNCRQAW